MRTLSTLLWGWVAACALALIARRRPWPFEPYDMFAEPNGRVFTEYRVRLLFGSRTSEFLDPSRVVGLEWFRVTALLNDAREARTLDDLLGVMLLTYNRRRWRQCGQILARYRGSRTGETASGMELWLVRVDLARVSGDRRDVVESQMIATVRSV